MKLDRRREELDFINKLRFCVYRGLDDSNQNATVSDIRRVRKSSQLVKTIYHSQSENKLEQQFSDLCNSTGFGESDILSWVMKDFMYSSKFSVYKKK